MRTHDKQTAFRLPSELVVRLDTYAERLGKHLGLRVTRADAARMLLDRGLTAAEGRVALPRAPRKERPT